MTKAPPLVDLRRIALVGVPNCGKTALFNRLTGSHQKVANYPGVTVERKEGQFSAPHLKRRYTVLDLPGTYSLLPTTIDEAITRDAVRGRLQSEPAPELLLCVADATNLQLSLRLVLELRELNLPMLVALNMSDLAAQRGYHLNRQALEAELGVPVVETVAVRSEGVADLLRAIDVMQIAPRALTEPVAPAPPAPHDAEASQRRIERTQAEAKRILQAAGYVVPLRARALAAIDTAVLHPLLGPVLLAVLLFMIFQAVFS